jgi:hypothetical protein
MYFQSVSLIITPSGGFTQRVEAPDFNPRDQPDKLKNRAERIHKHGGAQCCVHTLEVATASE